MDSNHCTENISSAASRISCFVFPRSITNSPSPQLKCSTHIITNERSVFNGKSVFSCCRKYDLHAPPKTTLTEPIAKNIRDFYLLKPKSVGPCFAIHYSHSRIDDIIVYRINCSVAHAIHFTTPRHLVLSFECFCYTLPLCSLFCKPTQLLLCLFINVSKGTVLFAAGPLTSRFT